MTKNLSVSDPRKLWDNIKKATNTNTNKESENITLNHSGETETAFNEFFTNIAEKTRKGLPPCSDDPLKYTKRYTSNLTIRPPSAQELLAIFKSLRPKTSYGYDNISSKVIKSLKFELLTPMKIITEKMIHTSTFPQCWKKAKVVPLHKKGDRKDVNNYRPISLLPALSKIGEKAIATQIYKYFEDNNIFPRRQYGFRQNRSTMQAVMNLTYEMGKLKSKRQNYAVLLMDLSKAFDLIDHQILQDKLKRYGSDKRTLQLISSYLTNRTQYVSTNGKDSAIKTLPAIGCPQGSNLGPLLYLIYTVDIENVTDNFAVMYADDTAVLIPITSKNDLGNVWDTLLQYETNFHANKLKINTKKTEMLSNKELTLDMGTYRLSCTPQSSANYLGIRMNGKLCWKDHMTHTANKARQGLYALAKLKKVNNVTTKKLVFNALINSHINYGIHLWSHQNSEEHKQIRKIHKAGVRMIVKAHPKEHSEPIYKQLGILKLEDMAKPLILSEFVKLSKNHNSDLRTYYNIQKTKTRSGTALTSKYKNSLSAQHCKLLRELPSEIHDNITARTKVSRLKSHLVKQYSINCDITNCYSCKCKSAF